MGPDRGTGGSPTRSPGLIARVRGMMGGGPARADTVAPVPPAPADLAQLEARIDRLEAQLEGLQDAVFRLDKQTHATLDELRRQLEPAELARALSDDARRRGL